MKLPHSIFSSKMANILQVVVLFLIMLASAKALRPSSFSSIIGVKKGRYWNAIKARNDASLPPDFELRNYSQTLDHFNYGPESYITFQQRYAINFKYWGGASTSSPIFLYTGDEASLDGDLVAGFLVDNARRFKALLIFVEHRYYGESNPFGSKEAAYNNSSTLQYFSSAQALADYAELLRYLKKNLSAENSPVIAIGGSYGGMLAAWFRLKYPHMVIGALASSAPILYFDDITPQDGYCSVASKDFKDTSESCYQTIKSSWAEIDNIAAKQNGLATLSQMFNTCSRLNTTDELKEALKGLYFGCAQYDDPKDSPVSRICDAIDGEPNGTSVLNLIISGLKAIVGNSTCNDISETEDGMYSGWYWQVCTEMVIPIGCSGKNEMFEASPFDLKNYSLWCKNRFNVNPRPHWITTEYGGHNIKKVLERFGSNIIFSNGLRDPYSSGGVLQNISNSIVALYTEKGLPFLYCLFISNLFIYINNLNLLLLFNLGSHCLDILEANVADPEWLISQRNAEMANILQAAVLFLIMLASAKALRPSSASSIIGLKKGRYWNAIKARNDASLPPDFELRTYSQTLDHFNYGPESYITFQQRYAINFKYWGGASTSSPIFLYTGDEASLDGDLFAGFLVDHARRFKALLIFVEHRYYGESNPFGSKEAAYNNSSTLQYFSSAQALADYAELLRYLKENLSAENSPVIAMGGSYGGTDYCIVLTVLAAWFRLKYPHMVIGALASSAPILYFDDITPQNGYCSVATKDFEKSSNNLSCDLRTQETSESCYQTIKSSWTEIDNIAAKQNGLATLSQMFNICSRLNKTDELKEALVGLYFECAQYDDPKGSPVSRICDAIDGEPNGTSVLNRIISGIKAIVGNSTCIDISETEAISETKDDMQSGWDWQVCTEMVIPIGCSGKNMMFETSPFDLKNFSLECKKRFNVNPRPHWITTEYGGHNIKKVLERFGSNIIFSNGLRDPYSSGGVLQNISNSIVALYTEKGSHCLDILEANVADPEWLISQRNAEVQIMENWIEEYNAEQK
ncbi:hypothetical protein IEQ34_016176 [Dendrobium chrysotoxum]|uniref:Lysosomal Pro-X carboxypeptidase n=1 Tax=Dendrobium chrysotoxum TaxID=161865 RepID=A0AAV7GEL1_DENCH|nr:hypothetical protein IEQ34_016176 [Dendrobium chrysotoxum]